jgi:phosphoglycerol geranylgeranyltransferase
LTLLDPDKLSLEEVKQRAKICEESGVDAILIGSSFLFSTQFEESIRSIKQACSLPVIIFPGNAGQISGEADAILFLCLISGRNPEYLIGEHVKAAPFIKQYNLEAISTGYMLIESGTTTSVEFMSNTIPIPRNKPDLAVAHALAGEFLGMKMIYMDGGSGAKYHVPTKLIEAVKKYITIPLIIGGGIKTPEVAEEKIKAGADFIVVGTAFEEMDNPYFLREFSEVVHHQKKTVFI